MIKTVTVLKDPFSSLQTPNLAVLYNGARLEYRIDGNLQKTVSLKILKKDCEND